MAHFHSEIRFEIRLEETFWATPRRTANHKCPALPPLTNGWSLDQPEKEREREREREREKDYGESRPWITHTQEFRGINHGTEEEGGGEDVWQVTHTQTYVHTHTHTH